MRGNLANREPKILADWEKENLYQQLREKCLGRPKFILHDGPPYANGDIHIGHAVNKIIKDIIIKSMTLGGYDAPYIPGWDCHGLPIELNVEKKKGKAGNKITHKEFRDACRVYANKQVDGQKQDFKRLGILGDWDNPYLTMDYKFEANIVRTLGKIVANGHLHKGSKPVHWCTDCGSALAEAEVEYEDKNSPAIDVRFNVVDTADFVTKMNFFDESEIEASSKKSLALVIWTTTPWTLPANQAVALHADVEYVLVEIATGCLLLAEPLYKEVMARYEIEQFKVLASCKGSALEYVQLQHPFYQRQVPVILGDHVTVESGTGAVHTAPGHGQEDYAVGLVYDLPIDNPVAANGCFIENTEFFAGTHVFKANDSVLEVLKERGALLHHEKINHSYPHCWRHKTPIIFRATPQWFISMDQNSLRKDAMAEVNNTTWLPEWGQARIQGMIENRPDWCISRQRTWGVPITIFVDKESSELHPRTAELFEVIAKKIEQQGIAAWFELTAEDLSSEDLLGSDADKYIKVADTLDVWFDSGVTHACVLKEREQLNFPADLYLEGSDQHRGWFQSSLLTSVAINKVAPYKEVLTHGFVVDAKGKKMSKSLGNVVAPQKIVNNLGADILRLWVASTDYSGEITVSDEILKRTSDTYRRIRNTARFMLANMDGFDPAKNLVVADQLLPLDRWIIERSQDLQQEIIESYEQYEFRFIYQKVHNFCSEDLGAFYLDIIKDRQYTTQSDSLIRCSAQTALYHISEAFTRWIAPILSFTADELWSYLPGKREKSVLFDSWYAFPIFPAEKPLSDDLWQQLIAIRMACSKELEILRNDKTIGSSLDAEITLFCDKKLTNSLSQLGEELRFVLICSEVTIKDLSESPEQAATTDIEGLAVLAQASAHKKCVRCWHHRSDVGSHAEHTELCGRCVENVAGDGEKRLYA
ncbi:MAG: isoleucine--tRNA ligase [Pseudomonadota bacterium]